MKKLWIAFIVLATLGSIYPFDFQTSELDAVTMRAFLHSCCRMASRGDILGNIILFVPIGFTGLLAMRSEDSASRRLLVVCTIGFIVALALQIIQIFLPSRDENLQDVVWNLFGTTAGTGLAILFRMFSSSSEGGRPDVSLVPLTLVGTWLIYRLAPFVPSFDLQLIKDSLKPLFKLQLVPINVIHDVTAWVVVAYLLRHAQRGLRWDTYLLVLIITVFCLEVLIVDNSINFSSVVAAMLAILLWWMLLRHIRWQEGALVLLLFCTLAVTGLAPFDTRMDSVPFNWFPFHGFLGGSMYINTQSAAEKVFLYGSLVYLLRRTKINVYAGIFIGFLFVTLIEIAQMRFVGHTPEITDPLLVIFAAIALLVLEEREEEPAFISQLDTASPITRSKATAKSKTRSGRGREKWARQTVNLRRYQFDFLVSLSRAMGVSVSRVTRRIVVQFIDGLGQDTELTTQSNSGISAAIESPYNAKDVQAYDDRERWVSQSINLREYQFDFLESLSKEMRVSVSNVTRQIVAQFIDRLRGDHEQE